MKKIISVKERARRELEGFVFFVERTTLRDLDDERAACATGRRLRIWGGNLEQAVRDQMYLMLAEVVAGFGAGCARAFDAGMKGAA